jgi:hypothetical protein
MDAVDIDAANGLLSLLKQSGFKARKVGKLGLVVESKVKEGGSDPHHNIMMALGANTGTKLDNLERLLSDHGIDPDLIANTQQLKWKLPDDAAEEINAWMSDNDLRLYTESKIKEEGEGDPVEAPADNGLQGGGASPEHLSNCSDILKGLRYNSPDLTDELMDLLHTHDKVHDVTSETTPEELAPMLGDGDADEIVHWMENKGFKLFAESRRVREAVFYSGDEVVIRSNDKFNGDQGVVSSDGVDGAGNVDVDIDGKGVLQFKPSELDKLYDESKKHSESFKLPRRKKNEKAGAPYRPSNFTERFFK